MKFWISIILLLISVAYTFYGIQSLSFQTHEGQPGAGFFPVIIGSFLIIFSLINVIIELKERSKEADDIRIKNGKEIVWTLTAMIIFVATLRPLGGLISMILFMALLLFALNRKKNLQNILISLVFPILIYGLFDWFNAGLPRGLLGF